MKFAPKCCTKLDIGKFIIKFGNFCLLWEKIVADYRPQICPMKIPVLDRIIEQISAECRIQECFSPSTHLTSESSEGHIYDVTVISIHKQRT